MTPHMPLCGSWNGQPCSCMVEVEEILERPLTDDERAYLAREQQLRTYDGRL